MYPVNFSMNPDPASWVSLEGGELAFDQYPDGSFQFRITSHGFRADAARCVVWLKSTLPAAIMAAAQVVDALREGREAITRIQLRIQTMPDQRGDKQGKEGACIPARVTAQLLAATDADEIVVYDVHSPVSLQFLNEYVSADVYHVSSLECFQQAGLTVDANDPKVVAVDHGAVGRARAWADHYHGDMIFMDKKRDPDGKIIGHQFTDNPQSMLLPMRRDNEVWVIDDLCDGGATFISVAKALRAEFPNWKGKLHLFVTHGLFSKGRRELLMHFDSVNALFSYDDWARGITYP